MERNTFGFLTLLVLGMCYLVYISKNETTTERPSYTVSVYNGLVQREIETASKFRFFSSFYIDILINFFKIGVETDPSDLTVIDFN